MGIEVLSKIKGKLRREYALAFIVAFLGGLIVHMYKFTNNLPNHDSMYNFYSDQNVVGSGRWFLSIACGISSYYDLPWVNGILSILFIALTAVLVVCLLKIYNPIAIFLTSGILVTYPAVTETFCFGFTADGYMLAMLLSALSVLVVIRCKHNLVSVGLSAALLCLTCAIYQAYVSFAIVLFLCWLILAAFNCEFKFKNYFVYIVRFVVSVIIGMVLFYCIWKLCMATQGVEANDYQGISKIGFLSLSEIVASVKKVAVAFISVILEKNILKHGISLYGALNLALIAFSLVVLIIAAVKSKIYKSKARTSTVIGCFVAIPFAVCMWQFVSAEVDYSLRMMQSIALIYILFVVICERYVKGYFSAAFAILNVVIIANLAVQANVAYYYLNYEYENTYAEAVRLEYALDEVCKATDYKYEVAIIGERALEVALDQTTEANDCFMYTTMIEESLLFDSYKTRNFLENVLYFDGIFADAEIVSKIMVTEEYQNMKPWFDGGSIEIIDDVITVKLG